MKKFVLSVLLCLALLPSSAAAQEQLEIPELEQLQFTDQQVQDLFGLFLSKAPQLMSERPNSEQLIYDLAPQALQILNYEQREFLSQLAPEEQLTRFGSMSKEERTRFIFDNAERLVHPSKKEWLRRVEEMTEEN